MHRISSQFNNTDTQYQLRKQEVRQAMANTSCFKKGSVHICRWSLKELK